MKNIILSALILFSTSQVSVGQELDMEQIKKDVEYLADDKLEGRETGTKGEIKAAKYIAKRFKKLGISPKGDEDYYQYFSFKPRPENPHKKVDPDTTEAIEGRNVVGYIDNAASSTVVIGAHYDHLGWGGAGSLAAGERAIHNGADDNASGVAAMIALGEALLDGPNNNNYLLIAFSGEEKGLWGSNYYSKNASIPVENMNYMINMDMVGRLNEEKKLAVNGTGTSPKWEEILSSHSMKELKIVKSASGIGPSDHTSFYLQDVPVLHFFTGQHEDYHKPSDDADKVNYEGIVEVGKYIYEIIRTTDKEGKLAFSKTKEDDNKNAPRFKVTLGVVPDYLFDGEGMRIDGVREDKPASNAGMLKGDVVIQLGDIAVKDMMSYMKALSKFEKGQKTQVKFMRDEKEMSKEITF